MKKNFILLATMIAVFILHTVSFAVDGNVWLVDKNGKKHFTCPVRGNDAVVDEDTKYSDYKGDRYYFCSPGCKPAFEADPVKYIEEMRIPGNVVKVKGKKQYFNCPITSEIGKLKKDTPFSDYNGKRYYLCCPDCKPKFDANPQEYIDSLGKKTGKQCDKSSDCCTLGCTSCGK
ncbi:MAG: YHS domain-containing protein [candidate division Zixibacteria bacterium]|nr:YHS domain-containing protein [Candidatus Tariuqbacter arcticus]